MDILILIITLAIIAAIFLSALVLFGALGNAVMNKQKHFTDGRKHNVNNDE